MFSLLQKVELVVGQLKFLLSRRFDIHEIGQRKILLGIHFQDIFQDKGDFFVIISEVFIQLDDILNRIFDHVYFGPPLMGNTKDDLIFFFALGDFLAFPQGLVVGGLGEPDQNQQQMAH